MPPTILREGPQGIGSLQFYVDVDPENHYFTFREQCIDEARHIAAFDVVINNADRKGSHILFEKGTRHLYAIDHGLCFNIVDKLRTVIWDFAGEPLPAENLDSLRGLISPPAGLVSDLLRFLSPDEIEALSQRARTLVEAAVFPQPPAERRAFPYPPL